METKSSLDNFMLKINSDQSKLHDEITSIKETISLEKLKTQNNLEYIIEKSGQMHTEDRNTMDHALKRLQSIQELIKNHQMKMKENQLHAEKQCTPSKECSSNTSTSQITDIDINQTKKIDIVTTALEIETSTAKDASPQQGRSNKLIIGSSMVKGIEPRGLPPDIRINVNRGADSLRITKKLHYMDLSNLSDVIIYAGGIDGPNGTPPRKTEANLEVAIREPWNRGAMYGCV